MIMVIWRLTAGKIEKEDSLFTLFILSLTRVLPLQ